MSTGLAGNKTVADARRIFMLAIECSINKCHELGFEHAVVMEAIKGTANSLISWGELADLINGPPSSPPALHVVRPPETQLRLPFTPTEHSSMFTNPPAETALLRCPHTDQPPLEVTWFCGQCSRCYGSVQVPKHSFDKLVAGGRRVTLVCFECWTSADNNSIPLARVAEGAK